MWQWENKDEEERGSGLCYAIELFLNITFQKMKNPEHVFDETCLSLSGSSQQNLLLTTPSFLEQTSRGFFLAPFPRKNGLF
jgi:hypothetical protein